MNRIHQEVTEFLVGVGIAPIDQHIDYKLEIAYRIGYQDAIRNYGIWKDVEQHIGCRSRAVKEVLARFKNSEVPNRF